MSAAHRNRAEQALDCKEIDIEEGAGRSASSSSIQLDMPMFTPDHVGGVSACKQLAVNCQTHLKASLLTQVQAWVQHQLIGLWGKTSSYNLSMNHPKKLAAAIVEHALEAPLDEEMSMTVRLLEPCCA